MLGGLFGQILLAPLLHKFGEKQGWWGDDDVAAPEEEGVKKIEREKRDLSVNPLTGLPMEPISAPSNRPSPGISVPGTPGIGFGKRPLPGITPPSPGAIRPPINNLMQQIMGQRGNKQGGDYNNWLLDSIFSQLK
jgi:hypothetical protein